MTYEKRSKAIVCFGDIRGFTSWEQGLTAPDIEFPPFMNKFSEMVRTFSKRTGYHVKNLGDAYMSVKELSGKRGDHGATRFLVDNYQFGYRLLKMINKHPWPRPDGFRVRAAYGHMWKRVSQNEIDYIGRHANKAHKLLGYEPKILFVCDQSVKEIITMADSKKYQLKFTHLKPDRRIPDGLTKHDMECLYKLEVLKDRV